MPARLLHCGDCAEGTEEYSLEPESCGKTNQLRFVWAQRTTTSLKHWDLADAAFSLVRDSLQGSAAFTEQFGGPRNLTGFLPVSNAQPGWSTVAATEPLLVHHYRLRWCYLLAAFVMFKTMSVLLTRLTSDPQSLLASRAGRSIARRLLQGRWTEASRVKHLCRNSEHPGEKRRASWERGSLHKQPPPKI